MQRLFFACVLLSRALAQEPSPDNLVHGADYQCGALGSLGAVVERGTGPVDMVLVSGFGLGASAFGEFQRRNAERYHMLAVTLPGFEGSAAPPMPPPGTSYGAQTWTRAAADAVVRLVEEHQLARPVLVGHSLNGTQVAVLAALEHPERVRAVVLLAGSTRFEPTNDNARWPRGLTAEQKANAVDDFMAPKWFKTVTRATWVDNNFKGDDYSVDAERGALFARRANEPPLPVLVRYLCEFHAADVLPALAESALPVLVVQPTFTEELRADPARTYLRSFFDQPWRALPADRPHTEILRIEDAGLMVMDDQAEAVDAAVAAFVAAQKS